MDVVKAGWLWRQSHGLFSAKWERYWYVLNRAGDLMCFSTPQDQTPRENKTVMYAAVVGIKVGENCKFRPPEGQDKFCLFELKMLQKSPMRFCGESPDDRREWALALEAARTTVPGGQAQGPAAPYIAPFEGRGPRQGQVLATADQQTAGSGFQGNVFLPNYGGYEGKVLSLPGQQAAPPVVRTETNPDGTQTMYVRDSTPQYVVMNDPPLHRNRRGYRRDDY